jgi:hypothetical protein
VDTPHGWLPVAQYLCAGHYTRALELADGDRPPGLLRLTMTSQESVYLITYPALTRACREYSNIATLAPRESVLNANNSIRSAPRSQGPV